MKRRYKPKRAKSLREAGRRAKVAILWSRGTFKVIGTNTERMVSKTRAQLYFKRYSVIYKVYSPEHMGKVYFLT